MPRMKIDIEDVAELIGVPIDDWAGRCHEIASKLLKCNIIKGELCYGVWAGSIHPDSHFAGRKITHHGWIECSNGEVVDPTRWVFECAEPYIYVGPRGKEYDFGGNDLRAEMCQNKTLPPPPGRGDKSWPLIDLTPDAVLSIRSILQHTGDNIGVQQLFYLANCHPSVLGESIVPIYEWIIGLGHSGLIPIDNRRRYCPDYEEAVWPKRKRSKSTNAST